MSRSVERLASQRTTSFGRSVARSWTLTALVAGRVLAETGDGPDLTPPSGMVIISKPANPTPPPVLAPSPSTARPTTPSASRATLALPGMMPSVNRPSIALDPPLTSSGPSREGPTLDGPLEMGGLPEPIQTGPTRSGRPLVLESTPADELPPPGSSTRTTPSSKKPTTPPPATTPAPARRQRFFGLLGAPPATTRTTSPGRSVAADLPLDDPAADSALKRRIERQARDVVGNRARSVEVRLEGKEATIQVNGAKLFQKRALRKQLEALPGLSGLRATIEFND